MKLTPFTDVAGVTGTISLLHYWHEAIMAKLASVLDLSAVPIQVWLMNESSPLRYIFQVVRGNVRISGIMQAKIVISRCTT